MISEPAEDWAGCCSHTNSHFLKFIMMVLISIIILGFSIAMIIMKDGVSCEVYFSLISAILGIFAPSPNIGKH